MIGPEFFGPTLLLPVPTSTTVLITSCHSVRLHAMRHAGLRI